MAAGVANFFLLDRCAYDNTPGAKALKTFKFLATGPWFGAAVKRCQCTRKHEPLMLTHVGEDGSVKTDGRQNLMKQSGFHPGSHPSSKFRAPGPWQRLRIHGVTHGVMLGQQRGREHMNIAAKQSRTHGMTHGVSKAPVLMIHGLTCRVGE